MSSIRFGVAASFAAASMTAFCAQSFAQTILDPVVVTSTKLSKNAADLGVSLVVVSTEDLRLLDGAEDLTERVAGLQAAVANGSQIAFQIRGIGAVDHQALTPTAAAVYVDGIFQATNVQTSPLLFDLERVEVLKGPQGSLYGRNASSGAINFVSIDPRRDDAGYIRSEIGNFDRFNLQAGQSFRLNDKVSTRLAGRYLSEGPVLDNVVTNSDVAAPQEAGGKRDEFGIKALTLWQPSEQTEVLFNLSYAEDNGINAAPRNAGLNVDDHEISIGPDGVQDTDNEFYTAAVQVDHIFGAVSLTSLSAFTGYNQRYGFDFDGTPAPFDTASFNANLRYDRDFSQFSQETRLNYSADGLELMAGLYLEAEWFDQEYLIWCGDLDEVTQLGSCRYVVAPRRVGPAPASPGTATALISLIEQERETAALFTHNTISLSDRLDLTLGARLTHETIDGEGAGFHIFDDGVMALNNQNGLGLAEGANSISETYLSGAAGVTFQAADGVLAYLSYSNGFKSGGFNGEVINNATHFSDEGLFDKETVDAIEAGVKLQGARYEASIGAFYQLYDQPQARIFVPFSVEGGGSFTSNSLSNLDEATSFGLEFDLRWLPIDGLEIGAGLVLNDTEIQQEVDPAVPQNAADFDGNRLPFASEVSATLSARYNWTLTPDTDASVGLNAKYQSGFYLDAEGLKERYQKGYTVIDAEASLLFVGRAEVGAYVRNLLNEDYAVSGFGFIGYNTFRSRPRTYGLQLGYTF